MLDSTHPTPEKTADSPNAQDILELTQARNAAEVAALAAEQALHDQRVRIGQAAANAAEWNGWDNYAEHAREIVERLGAIWPGDRHRIVLNLELCIDANHQPDDEPSEETARQLVAAAHIGDSLRKAFNGELDTASPFANAALAYLETKLHIHKL